MSEESNVSTVRKHKERNSLFAEAISSGETSVGGSAASGKGSAVAKRIRKQDASDAALSAEIRAEGDAINKLFSERPPIAPPRPRPQAGVSRPADSGKSAAADALAKAKVVGLRDTIARYNKLVESNPDRYGDVSIPEIRDKMTVEELKAAVTEIETVIRRRAGTNNFKSFFFGLFGMLEKWSMAGLLGNLNLVGLEREVFRDGRPPEADYSPAEEYEALVEELAVKYDSWFAVSPELRLVGLLAGTIAQVNSRNQALMQAYSSENRIDDQQQRADV